MNDQLIEQHRAAIRIEALGTFAAAPLGELAERLHLPLQSAEYALQLGHDGLQFVELGHRLRDPSVSILFPVRWHRLLAAAAGR